MDPLLAQLFQSETNSDGGDPGAAPADPVVVPEPVTPDTGDLAAPEPVAATSVVAIDSPEFQDAVQRQAAELLTQMGGFNQPAPEPAAAQAPPDLNAFLNPFEDGFGQNLAEFLSQRDQWLLGQIGAKFDPLTEQAKAQKDGEGKQIVNEYIESKWDKADGALTDKAKETIVRLAPQFLNEANRRYGVTDENHPMAARAASDALSQATETVRSMWRDARTGGIGVGAGHIAALAGAPGTEPGAGLSGVAQMSDTPLSAKQLAQKYGGRAAAIRT